jgi:hypothetical protein
VSKPASTAPQALETKSSFGSHSHPRFRNGKKDVKGLPPDRPSDNQRFKGEVGMARQRHRSAMVLSIAALIPFLGIEGCKPARPSNVPENSVYAVGANVGWWQRCSFEPKQDIDHCQIFNVGGDIISDEVFLPYDGGDAAKQSELEIVSNSKLAGPQYVCLKNGRILIPKSTFEGQKRYLDWATGKSKTR